MHLTLRARGAVTGVPLFELSVDGDGNWHYRSRAVAGAHGRLPEPDRAQLKARYAQVDWDDEVLNGPTGRDAHTLFELEVTDPNGGTRLYQFDDGLHHRSWQFRDLIHFLRDNVATGGNPVGAGFPIPGRAADPEAPLITPG